MHARGIRENLRSSKNVESKAKISERIRVAKSNFLSFVSRILPLAQLISGDLNFKSSKVVPQNQHDVLTNENFLWLTKARWDLISQSDVSS